MYFVASLMCFFLFVRALAFRATQKMSAPLCEVSRFPNTVKVVFSYVIKSTMVCGFFLLKFNLSFVFHH